MARKTYDLSTDIGKVRFAIGDTDITTEGAGVKPNGQNFTDPEIQAFITQADNQWSFAVPSLLRILANMYAMRAAVIEQEQYREDLTRIAGELRKSAQDWADNQSVDDDGGMASAFSSNTDAKHFFGTNQWGASVTDQTPDD